MNPLERTLTYCDKAEINEYLEGNTLNSELYVAFLANKDNCYNWKHSAVDTFNEVYLQCTRVFNDPHPEDQFYERYLNDAKDTLVTRYASDMIFSMVNAIFTILKNKPQNITYFQTVLQSRLKDEQCFYSQYLKFAEEFIAKHGTIEISFPYQPASPVSLMLYSHSDWNKITHNYDERRIRQFVNRYQSIDDKLTLVRLIELAYDKSMTEPVEGYINPADLPF